MRTREEQPLFAREGSTPKLFQRQGVIVDRDILEIPYNQKPDVPQKDPHTRTDREIPSPLPKRKPEPVTAPLVIPVPAKPESVPVGVPRREPVHR